MIKYILPFVVFTTSGLATFAQCDKKIVLTATTTEYLDSAFIVQRSVSEKTIITIDKDSLIIAPGNERMTGPVQSISCHWKVPYKEGKTVIHSLVSDPHGDGKNATITIEGKNEKVTLLLEVVEMPGRKIRLAANTFEEAK